MDPLRHTAETAALDAEELQAPDYHFALDWLELIDTDATALARGSVIA